MQSGRNSWIKLGGGCLILTNNTIWEELCVVVEMYMRLLMNLCNAAICNAAMQKMHGLVFEMANLLEFPASGFGKQEIPYCLKFCCISHCLCIGKISVKAWKRDIF